MLAAVLRNLNQPLEVTEVDIEAPRSGEVRVRIGASGVCHSDLSVIEGKIPFPIPLVLGHEGAGIVEEVGPGVTRVRPGDHVIVSWVATCETCFFCLRGQPQLCQSGVSSMGSMDDGTTRLSLSGEKLFHGLNAATFAEQAILRETAVVPIPTDIPLRVAALVGCAVTTGVGAAIHTARVEAGERVAVVGCGGVGMSIIEGCRIAGASRIIAIDPVEHRRQAALKFGATDTLAGGEGATREVKSLTDGHGADVVFEAVGVAALQEQAFAMTRPGGRSIFVGLPGLDAEPAFRTFFMVTGEKQIRGCFYGSARPSRDFPMLLDLYRAGRLDLDGLVSQTLPLARVNDALDSLRQGEHLRTVITMDGAAT